jgi:hypothetical protein
VEADTFPWTARSVKNASIFYSSFLKILPAKFTIRAKLPENAIISIIRAK